MPPISDTQFDTQLYIAVIGDIVRSRRIERAARGDVQASFIQLMNRLNQEFAPSLQGKFMIALGDEFEALIRASAASHTIPDLIWRIEEIFPNPVLRLGFGLGRIDTPITENVAALDGPAFHHALAFFFAAKGHSFPRTRRTSTSRLPAPRVSYQLSHRSRCRARPAEDLGSLVEVDLHHIAKTWAPVPARDELA